MRTSFLQDLYLQRPITMLIFISILSVIPWIGFGEFLTISESREVAVTVSMMETGNFILPTTHAETLASKPPMANWLMALFSLPQGYVSAFTARVPSAIAFVVMIGFFLGFLGKRVEKFQEAFIAVCVVITCLGIHRGAMTAQADMLFTAFVVIGIIQLFRWEEMQSLKGLPVAIPILLGCAVLTRGLPGLLLPLLIFFVYLLMIRKYKSLIILKALLYISVSSLFLPLIWYVAASKEGGDNFLNMVFTENFGSFLDLQLHGSVEEPGTSRNFLYNFLFLINGFMPWTLLLFFSIFGIKIHKPQKTYKQIFSEAWDKIRNMERVRLFSLVALVCIFIFYSVPAVKRSGYLLPAYPFMALFIAQYLLYLTEYRTKVIRFFAAVIASFTIVILIILILTMSDIIHPVTIAMQYTDSPVIISMIGSVDAFISSPDALTLIILSVVALTLGIVLYQMFRKINIKILYATFGLMFCLNILTDGVILRGIRTNEDSQPVSHKNINTSVIKENPRS